MSGIEGFPIDSHTLAQVRHYDKIKIFIVPQEQDPSQQPKPEAAASHMESRSSEEGTRTEERGSGEVLRKSTTSQHASEKVAKSVSGGEEDRKESQSPPIESEKTETVESLVEEKSSVEKVNKEEEEEKQASEKRANEQVSAEMAATGGVESTHKENKGEQKQAAGGGGGWGWGGWSSIWSSMSTVTESTAQALGEKVR